MLLKSIKREITGKKVKGLRASDLIPASLYGPSSDSLNISLDNKEFTDLYKQVGYSNLFDLELPDGKSVKALLKEVQFDYLGSRVLHVSIYKVDMSKKIVTEIPLTFIGVSMAVKNNLGLLVTPISNIQITCLPSDIPSEIVIDISVLNDLGENVFLKDIKLPQGVELVGVHSGDLVIASIVTPQKSIEEETPVVAEAATEEGAEAPVEGEEGKEKEVEKEKE